MRKRFVFLILMILAVFFCSSNFSSAKSLKKPITIVCAFSPGGATDQVNRALAEGMKEYLKVPINVVNMPGNNGGTATEFVWLKPHDGYYILGTSETALFLPANGGHYTTTKDWEYFMAGGTPGAVLVSYDSPYLTFKDLLNAAKASPRSIKVAAGVPGGLWHTKWALIAKAAGIKTEVLEMNGSKPSLMSAIVGDVDVVHVSIGEAYNYIKEKQLRVLCMSEKEPFNLQRVGKIPPITNDIPSLNKVLPLPQWLGLALPGNTPRPVINEITQAFKYAMNSKAVMQAFNTQLATPYGFYGTKAKKVAEDLESKFCWTLYDLGTAKNNPAKLKIARSNN